MNTIDYLKSGKTLTDLTTEFGMEVAKHPTLPLVILNYNQINSPKTHPIVRECRGLTLNTENWSLVSRAFSRFYNWGEVADEMGWFDWSTARVQEKVDGSLILLYWFDGQWRMNTRGSFGHWPIFLNKWQADYFKKPITWTWTDAFLQTLNINSLQELTGKLDYKLTYVLEFCSLWNKVIQEYPDPRFYLLTCYDGEEEVGARDNPLFHTLQEYPLRSAEEVSSYVNDHPESRFEGCVVKDSENRRWKIKNARYVALSHMKGNDGSNLYLPKYMVPWVLAGDDEICTYFPEVTDCYNSFKDKIHSAYNQVEALWKEYHQIEGQKEFALAIKGKTPFTYVLFNVRKLGKVQTLEDLKKAWRENEYYLIKWLNDKF